MKIEDDPCHERPLDLSRDPVSASFRASFKGTRITPFMIPLEETSQAGFCFSAMNG
jgi:hypothetical protein